RRSAFGVVPGDLGARRTRVDGVRVLEGGGDAQVQQAPSGRAHAERGDLAEPVVAEPVGVRVLLAQDATAPELVEAVEEDVVGLARRGSEHLDAELAADRR